MGAMIICIISYDYEGAAVAECGICGKPVYGKAWAHTDGRDSPHRAGHIACIFNHIYGYKPPRKVLEAIVVSARKNFYRINKKPFPSDIENVENIEFE